MARRVTAKERADVKRMHGEGRSLRSIAEELDRSPATISKISEDLGLAYDRAQTAAATKAKQWDNAKARAALVEWQYARMMKLARRLDAPLFETAGNSQEGPVSAAFGFVPAQDELHLSRAISSYAKTAADLEKIDQGTGSEHLVSAIGDIGAALSAVAASFESGDDGGA